MLTTDGSAGIADRLAGQCRHAGIDEVRLVGDLATLADLAESASGPVLVTGADLVAHTAVLRHLATSPAEPTVALVLAGPPVPGRTVVREDRGQVVAAGSPEALDGEATGAFGGALRVDPANLPALAAAARAIAAEVVPVGAAAAHDVVDDEPAVDRLFADLVARDAVTFAHRVRLLVARRVAADDDRAAAESAVAAVDADQAELRLSVKERDDFFTTFFVSTWSPSVTKVAARLRLSPTTVTMISVAFAVAAALLFGAGGRPALVAGAVLLYLGFVLDCVDGQLARYTRTFSAWGGWLDTMADRAKEFIVYAGLGYGATQAGFRYGWALAIAAMAVQTVRHMSDTWYGAMHDEAARRPRVTPGGGFGDRLSAASNRVQADVGSVTYWLKRTVVFPIGERWALVALAAALFDQRVALFAVLTGMVLALGYTAALRLLRARSMRVGVLNTVDASLHRDDGPLARALPTLRWPGPLGLAVSAVLVAAVLLAFALLAEDSLPQWTALVALGGLLLAAVGARAAHGGALDWLVPAALRAAEYLFAIAVGVLGGVPAWLVFGYVFVLTLHHYDLTARLEKRKLAPPLHDATLGWEGRSAVLTLSAITGIAAIGMATLGIYLLVVFVGSVALAWVIRPARAARAAGSVGGVGGRPPG
ncbi:CDP-alcohol phosphatidyltransferase [Salinispora tropica CNB-440]|uniref:CDP-alcohol phosphatidyltransferase n=1 Tax=Salinispora tropica (strain ATCC BAA-916 / DSM 44818 / JCM 13857 / NBRC 105044 / CNB-440) TaxID=369723 RepID=A4X218_SALTO|nr:CDP-alcohol phosphatidyltransferase [Salinispora tropica CNB-440]